MLHVDWSVEIDGQVATDRFNPFVISLEVEDRAGTTSDTARITLDDTDGQIVMPRKGARIVIGILGTNVFEGTTETPRSTGARGQGRLLTLSAKGFDPEGGAKAGRHFHRDDATLEDFLKDFGKRAGIKNVKIDPDLAKIKRAWWGPEGRSFLHEGQRLADELGATFKISGATAVFARRGDGQTPGGQALPTVIGTWGRNLVAWDIEPFDAREVFRDVRVRRFDRDVPGGPKIVEEKVDIEAGSGGTQASAMLRGTRADADDAKAAGTGRKTDSERDKGGGTATIDIEPFACAEGTFVLGGTRPGVDCAYRIESVTHDVGRTGSETRLTLKQPGKDAGQDTRKAGE